MKLPSTLAFLTILTAVAAKTCGVKNDACGSTGNLPCCRGLFCLPNANGQAGKSCALKPE
ncbi:hypothetical protein HYALB_00010043 [Hymenoscyphus albidus]|uniref:Uncharacterized protein n=1 Tax=Hymenoscyphus albidus TaxID=595503 RepID=A0A9N9LIK4_9HELO|nr:hypothetical protein HYALB_00010043 [Hymenoscyphus albidus]